MTARSGRPHRHLDHDRRADGAAVRRLAASPTTCAAGGLPDGRRAADGRRAPVVREDHGRGRADQAVRIHVPDLPQRAASRIDEAENDADRRRILKVLGDSALEEHAQWILIHRERSIDEKEGLKLG